MHIFDIAENGVDVGHFPIVHHCERSGITLHDNSTIPMRFQLLTSYPGDGIGIEGEHVKVTTEWSYYGPGMFHSISTADEGLSAPPLGTFCSWRPLPPREPPTCRPQLGQWRMCFATGLLQFLQFMPPSTCDPLGLEPDRRLHRPTGPEV